MALTAWALEGIGEVEAGDSIADLIIEHLAGPLVSGDVVVVTSKVVSKAGGLATTQDKDIVLRDQTDRVVARRGATQIVRTHHGLTLAAAGIDASNIEAGTIVALPTDPDGDARRLREQLVARTGAEVGVLISDTAGRAWRIGQTDIAIGAAGICASLSFEGVEDAYGNVLAVTAPAVIDEIAGLADLVAGKLGGQPVVVVRGLPSEWMSPDAVGAEALIRDEEGDLFGLGARDAVLAAVGQEAGPRGFPAADPDLDLLDVALRGWDRRLADVERTSAGELQVRVIEQSAAGQRAAGAMAERLRILARAMRSDAVVRIAEAD